MSTRWGLTIDCAHPGALAEFWALALGYVPAPVPAGFASWEEWLAHHEVPAAEWDDSAALADPDGAGPSLSFLKVPEGKVAKNRVHIDVKAGGRELPHAQRWPLVLAAVERLTAAGAVVVQVYSIGGRPDHVQLADPEGNEFCVV
ncbi:VOC family protein [Pseudonocardia sp. GCM10023141]|uniref:VOC family protein n=1 Tax=Pseudonocardia sp. GCM10023141 TaxID=3252653 RepID=UPI00360E4DBB